MPGEAQHGVAGQRQRVDAHSFCLEVRAGFAPVDLDDELGPREEDVRTCHDPAGHDDGLIRLPAPDTGVAEDLVQAPLRRARRTVTGVGQQAAELSHTGAAGPLVDRSPQLRDREDLARTHPGLQPLGLGQGHQRQAVDRRGTPPGDPEAQDTADVGSGEVVGHESTSGPVVLGHQDVREVVVRDRHAVKQGRGAEADDTLRPRESSTDGPQPHRVERRRHRLDIRGTDDVTPHPAVDLDPDDGARETRLRGHGEPEDVEHLGLPQAVLGRLAVAPVHEPKHGGRTGEAVRVIHR
nr:hypothetical protein [Georgenia yuyongxinii]